MKLPKMLAAIAVLYSVSFASTVTVDGEKFYLASGGKNPAEVIQEFLPKGQTLEDWTRLVSIRHVPEQASPKDYVAALAQTYHAAYPHMKFAADQAQDAWFIDFIAYPREKVTPTYVEWNFFIARKDAKKGVVVYQYAVRRYSKESLDDAFQNFDARGIRSRLLEKLKKEKFKIQEAEPVARANDPACHASC